MQREEIPYMEQRVSNNGFNQSSELLEHVQPHKEMKFSGKDESSSWSHDPPEREIVAALIITVVFAAAFTVPCGNKENETPIFLQSIAFIVFAVSDALALFSSVSSVLMFLAILTSRYSEDDFLESLPKKLMVGLITLFFSIASMMVAFGATFYIVFSNPWKGVIIPIASVSCLPVILFAWLQFPLLVEIFSSTYWPTIS
ncbi:hypothetical protein Pint_29128 [Pistacia integerrima]|uniref:Uncharacterized protein n=1 Tax=Pistacia integerrima TaxID=434235 RepID=A0ACC0X4G2_9ROSI|nr:hypothetical protein Pint_29128 [Pistacia integerrima]